ncbi:ABC transporter ATP-binding protein [Tessaracoccus sp. MC1865]|nr:ABC transporter ATP-binding protein [Tessaracoccus sp. MC1865]
MLETPNGAPTADVALRVRGLAVSFQGFRAVDGVDLDVRRGSVHSVIGPNGAGKSTLFNLISGLIKPTDGSVVLEGQDLTGQKLHQIARRGMSRAFQITNIFPEFTVIESIDLAVNVAKKHSNRMIPYSTPEVRDRVDEVLEMTGLTGNRNAFAKNLSHGDQRALEIALALAADPTIILLDEPTAGMARSETDKIIDLIRDLVDRAGVTVLFCEHDVPTVFRVSDVVTVMHQGKVLVEGLPSEIAGNKQVREVYLGVDA